MADLPTQESTTQTPPDANGFYYYNLKLIQAWGGRTSKDTWDTTLDIQTKIPTPGPDLKTKVLAPIMGVLQAMQLPAVYYVRGVFSTSFYGDSRNPYRPDNIKQCQLQNHGTRDMQESDVIDIDSTLMIALEMDTGLQGALCLRGALRERDVDASKTGHSLLQGDILLPQFIQPFNEMIAQNVNVFRLGIISHVLNADGEPSIMFRGCTGAALAGVSPRPTDIDRVSKNVQLKRARATVAKLTAAGVGA